MTWHMQQEDRANITTGCSNISRWILVSADSSTSMDKEEEEDEEEVVDMGTRSRDTMSFGQGSSPSIYYYYRFVLGESEGVFRVVIP